ncbi:MAG: hypothetical protein ACREHG_10495 [Candidatus Saccharimonadales bacterium]
MKSETKLHSTTRYKHEVAQDRALQLKSKPKALTSSTRSADVID